MNWLFVTLGAMVGAPLRFLTDRAIQLRYAPGFPWGTLTVNTAGCLGLGLLAGAAGDLADSHPMSLFFGIGLCGALTTFSTFSYESLRLAEHGARMCAALNVLANVTIGVTALFAGAAAAHAVTG